MRGGCFAELCLFSFFENSSALNSCFRTQKERSSVFVTVLKTSQNLTHIYNSKMFLNISPGAKQEKYVVVLVIQPRIS